MQVTVPRCCSRYLIVVNRTKVVDIAQMIIDYQAEIAVGGLATAEPTIVGVNEF